MEEILESLTNLDLLVEFTKSELEFLAKHSNSFDLKKGEYLLKMGETSNHMFIVRDGSLEISIKSAISDKYEDSEVVEYLKKGDLVGDMEIFENRPNIANVVAFENSRIISFKKEKFKEILFKNPKMNFTLITRVLSKWKNHETSYFNLLTKLESYYTKIQEQQKKLEEESRLKEVLVENISHELRTPLTIIHGIVDSLDPETNVKDEIMLPVELYHKIKQSSSFLLDLINDLLDFTQMTKGKFTLKPFWVDSSVLGEKIKDLKYLADKKNLKFIFKIVEKPDKMSLNVDLKRLNQIIFNLVSNAVKFTDKGKVKVSISYSDFTEIFCMLSISVQDSGVGISIADQSKIFDKFVRIQKKYSHIEGTGLGLSIVRSITDLMNGDIKLTSELGKGSEFIIDLPVEYRIEIDTDVTISKSNKISTSTEKLNLLLVDDYPDTHVILEALLKKYPIDVDSCYDGLNIVDILKKKDYDIILLDLMLPQIDGYEILKQIKEYYITFEIETTAKIIAFTALGSENELTKIRISGFDGHLFKPFTKNDLINAIYH